ncbi:MAG: ArsR family transcriptional regulator [Actinobacteria bacterium]|nr:ArsR family transcriptional regulator [Actinomycetota bacterium]
MTSVPTDAPAVSEHQRTVLYALKRRGEATVDDLAGSLHMTVSGARQHLAMLTEQGLVAAQPSGDDEDPSGSGRSRGRPRLRYRLTPEAETLFPKAYGELTNELLGYLADEDGTLVDKIFVRRRDQRAANAKQRLAANESLATKVRELANILDEDGYLAEYESLGNGTFRITEHNCAILSVAKQHPNACTSEIEFIRTVLPDADVERVAHIVSGQHHCAYLITGRANLTAG